MHSRTGLIACAGALFLAGCSGGDLQNAPVPTAEISTGTVRTVDLHELVGGYGVVQFDPSTKRSMNTQIEAQILELLARPGDLVDQGQIVLRLAPSQASAAELARIRNESAAAEQVAARTRRLRDDGLASDADVEAADLAALDLQTLARSLSGRVRTIAELHAPISGVVESVFVEPGDLVAAGSQLALIAPLDTLQAAVRLELEDAARIESGAGVTLTSLDNTGTRFESVARSVDLRVEPITRTATLYATIPAESGLLPGQAIRAEITAAIHPNTLVVPRRAVYFDEQGAYVFRVINDIASLTRIDVGITSGDDTAALSGLSANDVIVLDGGAVLSDGMTVKIVNPAVSGSTQ
ncbi:efflux RND transporter periplasmic adaptor subunit [uncultured Maricaulis sp.]|uniref:efflux RND transporter periplasmic adaptor subunit n=1 Tax=uncultured Maricaulis sp. TaxID=174710 RepID=UPI0030D94DD9